MSGRLIILPKKSYCPWKPENVAKVRRDEQREAERLEAERQRTQHVESEFRMARLKHGQQHETESSSSPSNTAATTLPKHINLFAQEENHEKNHTISTSGGVPRTTGDSSSKTTPSSNNPLFKPDYLGGQESHNRKNGVRPFYMQPQKAIHKEPNAARTKDDRFKFQMDPMQQFYIQPSVNRSSNNLTVEEATRALLSSCSSTTQNPPPIIPHTKRDGPSSTAVKEGKRSRNKERNRPKHHDPSRFRSKSRRRKRDYDVPTSGSDEESSQSSLSDHASAPRKHRSSRNKKRSHSSRRRSSRERSSQSGEIKSSSNSSSRAKR
eukprot:CAMPEP_0198284246 /NCGR_PEP_ID=MMETSP1449-20131203/3732_1 /TAXON_ID=420275 /ORGANISM="Attheya septentrionalis, Strain CCMP2084" /LENGTH=321 /DNA_ID=CAMNT_0043981215 /DNA_START=117 /DNA_END=1082 /DNA_ORIENTATION=-